MRDVKRWLGCLLFDLLTELAQFRVQFRLTFQNLRFSNVKQPQHRSHAERHINLRELRETRIAASGANIPEAVVSALLISTAKCQDMQPLNRLATGQNFSLFEPRKANLLDSFQKLRVGRSIRRGSEISKRNTLLGKLFPVASDRSQHAPFFIVHNDDSTDVSIWEAMFDLGHQVFLTECLFSQAVSNQSA